MTTLRAGSRTAILAAFAALGLVTTGFGTSGPQATPCGVWVVRSALATPAAWRRALDTVARHGCRRIYLQVSGRWDAYFPSAVFPPPAAPPRGADWDDPVGRALGEAHARGIEVHAWVNSLLAWSSDELHPRPDHVLRRHPEWIVADSRGRSMLQLDRAALDRAGLTGEGWFLDPAREAVRTELRRFLLELAVRYPLDGIHLDYIRYPTGWAPPGGDAAVTALVRLIRADLAAVRPAAILSAAVLPRPDIARTSFGQAWPEWLEEDLVDEVLPMVYRDSPEAVLEIVNGYPAGVPRGRLWVGLRVDRLTPDEVAETGRRLGAEGVAGVVLFSDVLLERR